MIGAKQAVMVLVAVTLALAGCEREKQAVKEDFPAARMAKAQADASAIATAVRTYAATCGQLPEALEDLTAMKTVGGGPCGPFLPRIPAPPTGWTPYEYSPAADGTFSVATSGGGTTVRMP